MALLRPTIWTQQPQQSVEIDWSNPITRGLVSAILPHTKRDTVLQAFLPSSSGTTSTKATSSGFALVTDGLNSSIYTTATAAQRVSEGTLLWLGDTYATPSNSACLGGVTYDSANSSPYVCIEFKRNPGGAGANSLNFTCSAGGVTIDMVTANSYQPMAGRLLIGTSRSGYQSFWIGRVGAVSLDQQNTYAGSLASTATSRIEVGDSLNSRTPDAACTVMALWNRALSDLEIRSISQNPWQIFKPIPRQLFVAASGGSGVTGTASITETAETVSSSGAVLVGGTSSTTNTTQTVSSSGNIAISGSASVTEAAETLSASGTVASGTVTGTASITEDAETLSASGTVVSGVVGTASITETAETVTASGSIAIGGTASISPNAQTVVSSGTIAITGTANVYELAETLTASGIALGGITGSADLTQAAQTLSAFATSVFPTIGRPDADVSNTGWTPSTGSDLYAMLDEVTPSDSDYISTNSVGAVCSIGLNATQYPGSASQQLSLRASSSTGNGLTVVIKDGATTIATRSLTLTPSFDLHTITLTAGEISAITTGNLTVEMTST